MKKIKGIQIVAKEIVVLTGFKRDVAYCKGFEEMIIDFTGGSNRVISVSELERMMKG